VKPKYVSKADRAKEAADNTDANKDLENP